MAIAFDAGTYVQSVTATSLTFAHTCSGTDRLLTTMGHDTTGASSVVTGITYNGAAMTKAVEVKTPAGGRWITLWYLVAPATGSNNVVVTVSSSQNMRYSALSYTGVDQTSPSEGTNSNAASGSTSSFSSTITTSTDNSWMIQFVKDETGGQTYTNTTGDTIRLNADAGGHYIVDTGTDITPAGSNTITSTLGTGRTNVKWLAFAFAPVSTGAYTQNINETVSIVASIQRGVTKGYGETLTITDTFSSMAVKLLATADALSVSDNIAARITGRTITEAVTITESLVKTFIKTLTEAITLTVAFAYDSSRQLNLAEALNVTETFRIALNGINAFWSDLYTDTADAWSNLYND